MDIIHTPLRTIVSRTPTPEAQARFDRIKNALAVTRIHATLVEVHPDGGIEFAVRTAHGDWVHWAIDAAGGKARMIG